jgi:hypothetical protein
LALSALRVPNFNSDISQTDARDTP